MDPLLQLTFLHPEGRTREYPSSVNVLEEKYALHTSYAWQQEKD